jgi:hypothetical protein
MPDVALHTHTDAKDSRWTAQEWRIVVGVLQRRTRLQDGTQLPRKISAGWRHALSLFEMMRDEG